MSLPRIPLEEMDITMLFCLMANCTEIIESELSEQVKRDYRVLLVEVQAELYRRRNDQRTKHQ